jgi:hypothetical protein
MNKGLCASLDAKAGGFTFFRRKILQELVKFVLCSTSYNCESRVILGKLLGMYLMENLMSHVFEVVGLVQ